jgi:putative glutamine amidotransferase
VKSRRPLVLIAPDLESGAGAPRTELDHRYVEAVRRAGGLPLILPAASSRRDLEALLSAAGGILLTGGDDLRATRWGEPIHPKARLMDARRERSDLGLAAEADRRGLPILGICLGMQVLNVARGGTLVQHLPAHRRRRRHPVTIEPGTKLRRILGTDACPVASSHHQAVARVGRGLRVSARSDDGLIEGIEDPRARFFVGVQWHPERMGRSPTQGRLLRAFVQACRG